MEIKEEEVDIEDEDEEEEEKDLVNDDDEVDVEDSDEDEDDLEDEEEEEHVDPAQRKYELILQRCEDLERENERTVQKILEVRGLVQRSARQKRVLTRRLDALGDSSFRGVPVVMPPGEDKGRDAKADAEAASSGKKRRRARRRKSNGEGASKNPVGRPPKKPRAGDTERRDPRLPKRPQNPFFQFCQEQRSRVQRDYLHQHGEQLSKKELTRLLAHKWREIGSEEKKPRSSETRISALWPG